MTVMRYPAGTRWLDYQQKREKRGSTRGGRSVGFGTLRVIVVAVGSAAAAWGLMHLTLRLLG